MGITSHSSLGDSADKGIAFRLCYQLFWVARFANCSVRRTLRRSLIYRQLIVNITKVIGPLSGTGLTANPAELPPNFPPVQSTAKRPLTVASSTYSYAGLAPQAESAQYSSGGSYYAADPTKCRPRPRRRRQSSSPLQRVPHMSNVQRMN